MMYRILSIAIILIFLPFVVFGHEGHKHQSENTVKPSDLEFRFLGVGETAPDFILTNQDGKEISLKDFRGKILLLTFIYTNCPTSCPITIRKFMQIQKDLSDVIGDQLVLLAITVDPDFDTPEVLKGFALKQEIDLKSMHFLTGDKKAVKKVLKAYGIWSIKDDEGYVDHPAIAYSIDESGVVGELLYGFSEEEQEEPSENLTEVKEKD